MKICYVAPGDVIHTIRWVKYFADNGDEVHLIARYFGECGLENVNLHLLKRFSLRFGFLGDLLSYVFCIIQVRGLIKKINPDIVHGHNILCHGLFSALSSFHPLVLTVWGSDVLINPKSSIIYKFLVKFLLMCCTNPLFLYCRD